GFLYLPPTRFPGRRPVIINIHGGPEGQSRPGFLGRNNYYVNELGVALIFPNVRGSTGHGKTFAKLDHGTLRDGAYRDIGALRRSTTWTRSRNRCSSLPVSTIRGCRTAKPTRWSPR